MKKGIQRDIRDGEKRLALGCVKDLNKIFLAGRELPRQQRDHSTALVITVSQKIVILSSVKSMPPPRNRFKSWTDMTSHHIIAVCVVILDM